MAIDPNDPKLEGYRPLALFRITDVDRTSRRIRDDPLENVLTSNSIYDYNVPSLSLEFPDLVDNWNL